VDPYAQVYSLGAGPPVAQPPGAASSERREIYGCVYGHRGAYDLGPTPHWELDKYLEGPYLGDSNVVLAGPIVAYEYREAPASGKPHWAVFVQDLRTGRTLRHEPTGNLATPSGEPEQDFGIGPTTAIVLKSNGSVAWIVSAGRSEGGYQVHAADLTGSRLLASGGDIDPTSLALVQSTLYWTQGGKPASAPLS
jgi:hypothetical protein